MSTRTFKVISESSDQGDGNRHEDRKDLRRLTVTFPGSSVQCLSQSREQVVASCSSEGFLEPVLPKPTWTHVSPYKSSAGPARSHGCTRCATARTLAGRRLTPSAPVFNPVGHQLGTDFAVGQLNPLESSVQIGGLQSPKSTRLTFEVDIT